MICSNCGTENKPGRKFCARCASPLGLACPKCGAAYDPGDLFCGECASPLTTGTASAAAVEAAAMSLDDTARAPVAERRLVSVLFADLVGFTTLAEGHDAEDTRELLNRYFELARDVIGRYGGTVEKFIGDAVMAVWGAPVAREDDAERAVRAGLELVDAVQTLGPQIQARAGVLTGEAAVTIGATNQGMVAGDLVNTASRLQSVAQPGTVLVGEATQRAASKAIAFEKAGEQHLKGKQAPVEAWRAIRVVAEVGGRNTRDTLEAPFVGRDDELRLLKDMFHATTREGRARLVSVIGPAGIGKTRLAWEFLKYIDGLADTGLVARRPQPGLRRRDQLLGPGRDDPRPLRPARDRRRGDDQGQGRRDGHHDRRRTSRNASWIEPALLALLGVETGVAPEQLFGAWRTFFERLAATAPVVLVFEDFHYADSGLIDFVDHLVEWSRAYPIYVVTLARPELLERRPDWGAGKRSFTSIYLEPLPEAAMRELLAGLVPGLPEAAVKAIVARADGIPLYAVETVRMLLAEGQLALEDDVYVPVGDLTSLAVPETLTALIAARLDALPPDDRALILDAAVLGQSFTPAALAAISGQDEAAIEPRLRALVARAAHRRQRPAQPGARPVRLRPGPDPRGRLRDARQARPQDAPPRRRAILRVARLRRARRRPRRPLPRRPPQRARGPRGRRPGRPGPDRAAGRRRSGDLARRPRPGGPVPRPGDRRHRGRGGSRRAARRGRGQCRAGGPLRPGRRVPGRGRGLGPDERILAAARRRPDRPGPAAGQPPADRCRRSISSIRQSPSSRTGSAIASSGPCTASSAGPTRSTRIRSWRIVATDTALRACRSRSRRPGDRRYPDLQGDGAGRHQPAVRSDGAPARGARPGQPERLRDHGAAGPEQPGGLRLGR